MKWYGGLQDVVISGLSSDPFRLLFPTRAELILRFALDDKRALG
jgi:hypothetical protein